MPTEIKSLSEVLHDSEPLDVALEHYLTQDKHLGKLIRHPLVYSVPHIDALNAFVNRSLLAKENACKVAIKKDNWSKYILLHERPHRLDALLRCINDYGIKGKIVPKLIREVWTGTENVWQDFGKWESLLELCSDQLRASQTKEERKVLADLPDPLTVYRGYDRRNRDGLSWTLSKSKAKWFASRHTDHGHVATRKINKSEIIFYSNDRGEQEVVVL